MTDKDCHCGSNGHPLHSVNCPVHGRLAQIEAAETALRELDVSPLFAEIYARTAFEAIEKARG